MACHALALGAAGSMYHASSKGPKDESSWRGIVTDAVPHLVPPHGGTLRPLLVQDAAEREAALEAASTLPKARLTSREVSDLIMLAMGAFSPLDGFMRQADYRRVCDDLHLENGVLWPIPITLAASKEEADAIAIGSEIALVDTETDQTLASMTVEEKYRYDKAYEASRVFGTVEREHPGVAKLFAQGDVYLAGPVTALGEGGYPERFPEFARPSETRAIFEEKGWKTIAAFQTRNPIHRSHEYLTKIAMEVCDGLLIHPIVGKLKSGDIPAEVRMQCYHALIERYYPKDKVVMKVYPMEMRYGGPREAILHAIIRQNFGCSHLIVGRDHAGVGSYYGPFEAQEIFDALPPGDLHLKPLKIDWTFWCHRCESIASRRTCPHGREDHLMISGTQLRNMLAAGKRPPIEYTRIEVAEILIAYYAGQRQELELAPRHRY